MSMRAEVVQRWKDAGGGPASEKTRRKVVYVTEEEKKELLDELHVEERFTNEGTDDLLVPTSVVFGVLSYVIVRVKRVELA